MFAASPKFFGSIRSPTLAIVLVLAWLSLADVSPHEMAILCRCNLGKAYRHTGMQLAVSRYALARTALIFSASIKCLLYS